MKYNTEVFDIPVERFSFNTFVNWYLKSQPASHHQPTSQIINTVSLLSFNLTTFTKTGLDGFEIMS